MDDPSSSPGSSNPASTANPATATTSTVSGNGSGPDQPRRKPVGKVRYPTWVWVFGIVGGLVAMACGYAIAQLNESNAVDTGNGAIEQLLPAPATQILSQAEVGVDLAPGYTARLTLNGIPIADDEVNLVAATNSVLFLPGPGKSVEEFIPGPNCLAVTYWKPVDGEASSNSATWCFEAL